MMDSIFIICLNFLGFNLNFGVLIDTLLFLLQVNEFAVESGTDDLS